MKNIKFLVIILTVSSNLFSQEIDSVYSIEVKSIGYEELISKVIKTKPIFYDDSIVRKDLELFFQKYISIDGEYLIEINSGDFYSFISERKNDNLNSNHIFLTKNSFDYRATAHKMIIKLSIKNGLVRSSYILLE